MMKSATKIFSPMGGVVVAVAVAFFLPAIADAQDSDAGGDAPTAPLRVVLLDDVGELFTGEMLVQVVPMAEPREFFEGTSNPFEIALPRGEYRVVIVQPAFEFSPSQANVMHDPAMTGDSRVEFRQSPLVEGRAVFADDRPFAQRRLRFSPSMGHYYDGRLVETDAEGRFRVRLMPGTYDVHPAANPPTVTIPAPTAGKPPFLGLAIEPFSPDRGEIAAWHPAGVDFEGPFTLPTIFARLQYDFDDYDTALDTLRGQFGFNLPLIGDPASGIQMGDADSPWTESPLSLFAIASATLAREGINFGRMDFVSVGLTIRTDEGAMSDRSALQIIATFPFAAERTRVMNDVTAMLDLRYSVTNAWLIPVRLSATLGAGLGDQSFFKIAARFELVFVGFDFEWRIGDGTDGGRFGLLINAGSLGSNVHAYFWARIFGNADYALRLGIGGAIF